MTTNDPLTLTIRRAVHDKNFLRLLNRTAQDTTLSYAALGLLVSLLSRPTDWQVKVPALVRPKSRRDAVYALLQELADAGYVTPRTRHRSASGQWIWTPYIVHEIPQPRPCPAQPETVLLDTVTPHPGKAEIKTNDRATYDRATKDVVGLAESESGETVFEAEAPEAPPAPLREGTETHGQENLDLWRALARLHVTPRLADHLIAQYGTARVWQVVRYMQQPANASLGIGWLRKELKYPTSVPVTGHALPMSDPPWIDAADDGVLAASQDMTESSAPGVSGWAPDPSIAYRVSSTHTATSLWTLVAHQLVLKGFRDIGTAALAAYEPATCTYMVQVRTEWTQQQLTHRYGKPVQGTLTGLHPGARVVFIVPDSSPHVSTG